MTEIILAILFILFSAFFFYSKNDKSHFKQKNLGYALLIFLLLFLFAGFRSVLIGNDSISYSIDFKYLDIISPFWSAEGRFEPGYQYFSKFIKIYVSDDTLWLFLISSFLIQFFFVRFMYLNSKILWVSIFLFVTFQYYFFFVSAIRQAMAQIICLIAYDCLKKDKLKSFYTFVLLAFTFHYSALIFIILPLFKNIKFTLKKGLLIGLITAILFVLLAPFLEYAIKMVSYGNDYLEQTEGVSDDFSRIGAIFMALMSFVIVLFTLFFDYHKNTKKNISARYEFWSALLCLIIGVLAIKFGILIRFTYYFGIFSVIMIPNVIATIMNKKTKYLITTFWIVITFFNIFIILYFRPEWFNFYPYKFYWEK
jgi:multisubunit Na+/H+ antiporter MnhG subunit